MFSKSLKVAVTPDFTKKSDCAKKLLSIKKRFPPLSLESNNQDVKDFKEFLFENAMKIVTKEFQKKM